MKKRISLILAIVMIASVFATAIPFAVMADGPTVAEATDVVVRVWASDTDDRSAATEAVAGGITLADLQAQGKLPDRNCMYSGESGKAGKNITLDLAMAGKYVWLEFETKTINIGAGSFVGTKGIGLFAGEGKKLYIDGNGAVINATVGAGERAVSVEAVKADGSNVLGGEVILKDITVNSDGQGVQMFSGKLALENSTIYTAGNNGLSIRDDGVEIRLDATSEINGRDGIYVKTANSVLITGTGGKVTHNGTDEVKRSALRVDNAAANITIGDDVEGNSITLEDPCENTSAIFCDTGDAEVNITLKKNGTIVAKNATSYVTVALRTNDTLNVYGTIKSQKIAVSADAKEGSELNVYEGALIEGVTRVIEYVGVTNVYGGTVRCTGTGSESQVIRTDNAQVLNMAGGLLESAKNDVIYLAYPNADINITGGEIKQLDAEGNAIHLREGKTGNMVDVNGASVKITGNIAGTAGTGTVNLVAGSLTGNINSGDGVTTVWKGFVVNGVTNTEGPTPDGYVETTPEATTPDPSVPDAPTGNDTDVIVKIYETGSTAVIKTVTRAEFTSAFAVDGRDILVGDETLVGKNLTLEFLADVTIPDDSEKQCGMSAASGAIITIKGNDHLIYGGASGNPALRFYGGGEFVINDLDIYHKGGSCVQYYNNAKLTLNACEWVTPDHRVFFLTGAGQVDLNEGTLISGGTYGIWAQSTAENIININAGATVMSNTAAIAFNGQSDYLYININGGSVICTGEGGAAINVPASNALNFINVNSGSIKGDILLAVGNSAVFELVSGSIEGAFVYEETGAMVVIRDGFVINGEAYGAPDVTTPEETTPEATPEVTTPEATPEQTTPEVTPEVTTPEVTTPDATTPPPAAEEGCAGCGGIAIAAQLVALICAAAIVIIKKK